MEMRAIEDVAVGEDLTPPLPPIAAVLHDAAVTSYCSGCFSTLPPHPFPPSTPIFPQNPRHVPTDTPTPLYCSPNCSSIDSHLHLSSGEPYLLSLFRQSPPSRWDNSSDLRLSLRLAYIFKNLLIKNRILPRFPGSMNTNQRLFLGGKEDPPFQENENIESPDYRLEKKEKQSEDMERIAGLMTNREKLVFGENMNNQFQENCGDSGENTENVMQRIQEGAKMMAKARKMYVGEGVNVEEEDEEFVLEEMVLCLVLTNAVEVQDKSGSSIGVAVYDTAFSWINHSCSPNACYRFLLERDGNEQPLLRITPAATNGLIARGDFGYPISERNGYGPRVIARSITAVNKGEEVTIAYTDLLQTKEMRQAELWLKYRFSCSCKRCAVVPVTYVDYALQALSADNPNSDNETEKLMQNFDNAITDYLSVGDPKLCCTKLENLLSHGDLSDKSLEPKEGKSPQKVKLHPCHHLSLNAYTTLASAYKVHASDLVALNYEVDRHKLEAFNMYKTSSAYSLLLAGVMHHLYMFESSLVTTVANFWINAGESLLNLARIPLWDSFLKQEPLHLELSSLITSKCNGCCLADTLEPNTGSPDQKMPLEEIKSLLYNCIASITPKVWTILASESSFLRSIQHPVDLSWLASPATSVVPDIESRHVRMNLILLSIHCLRYGALLSSICYGQSVEMSYYRTLEFLKEPVKI